jgi:hypothetical protein
MAIRFDHPGGTIENDLASDVRSAEEHWMCDASAKKVPSSVVKQQARDHDQTVGGALPTRSAGLLQKLD